MKSIQFITSKIQFFALLPVFLFVFGSSLSAQNSNGLIYKTDQVTKAQRFDIPPANWNQPNYNDSGWPFAIDKTGCLATEHNQAPAQASCGKSKPIWAPIPNGQCSQGSTDIVYFRGTFPVINAAWLSNSNLTKFYLFVKADNAADVYINGNLLISNASWTTQSSIEIPKYMLNAGSNLIAAKGRDESITGWYSAVICVNTY